MPTNCIALFPGCRACEEKRAWYTLFAYAQFPQDFWEFWNFHNIYSITIISVRYANFSHIRDAYHWPYFVQMMKRERWRCSALHLQELSKRSLSIPAKHCSTWLMQSFPLKFSDRLEQCIADRLRSIIAFDFKNRTCVSHREYKSIQCNLSAGKHKLTIVLV